MNLRRYGLPWIVAIVLTLSTAMPAAAVQSLAHTVSDGSVTQKHALYYNTSTCYAQLTGYAFVKWNTDFTRLAGSTREISHAKYRTAMFGASCNGTTQPAYDTGIRTYYPTFAGSNSRSYGLTLNWATRVPGDAWAVGTSHKAWYTRGIGGPIVSTICTQVNIANGWNACPSL